MAEALLRDRLAARGVAARVSSAGLLGSGQQASQHGVDILSERGIDMSAHLSTKMSADRLEQADLVLAMARTHLREAVVMAPAVWPRSFTLKQVVRRGSGVGPRRPAEPTAAWIARVHEGRQLPDILGDSPDDDVDDPIGRSRRVYARMVDEVDELTARLVELLWPPG